MITPERILAAVAHLPDDAYIATRTLGILLGVKRRDIAAAWIDHGTLPAIGVVACCSACAIRIGWTAGRLREHAAARERSPIACVGAGGARARHALREQLETYLREHAT